MPGGFLLQDDAVTAAQTSFDNWVKEQEDKARAAKEVATRAAQPVVQAAQTITAPITQAVTDTAQNAQGAAQGAQQRFDQWAAQQQAAQQPTAPQQPVTQPAATPSLTPTAPDTGQDPGAAARASFDQWVQQQSQALQQAAQPVQAAVTGAAGAVQSALPHSEEPATQSDTHGGPDLGQNWKTQFDFGQTYTGDYRTGTPHRGVDLVPSSGKGIGTEVDAFEPGTITNIFRDPGGAGGLIVYVQDSDGLTHAYMHLAGTQPGLAVGQTVQRGQPIAMMGESGTEGSPHLHYEVRKNAASGDPLDQLIDPRPYVSGAKQPAGGTAAQTTQPQTTQAGQPPNVRLDASSQDSFYNSLAPAAQWIQQKTGLNATAMLAIVANETGYGRSENARDKNNLFSIQGDGSNGSRWASYGSPLESFQAFADLIQKAPRYAQAWNDRGDPAKFIDDLRNAGYVADEPGYPAQGWVDQVKGIIGRVPSTIQQAADSGSQAVQGAVSTGVTAGQNALNQAATTSGQVAQGAQNVMQAGQSQLDQLRAQMDKLQADFKATQDALDAQRKQQQDALQQRLSQTQQDIMAPRDFGASLRQAQDIGQSVLNSEPARQAEQAVGGYFDRMGSGVQQIGQHAIANPLTPLITPGELGQELTTGSTGQAIGRISANDREITDAAANAMIAKAREMGASPSPEQEQAVRTAVSAFAPSTLPLMFLGGPAGVVPRVASGLGLTVASGVGQAAGEAVAPNLPEPLRPFAPLVGGLAAPLAAGVVTGLARAAINTLRSSGAASVDDVVSQVVRQNYGQNLRDSSGNIDPNKVAEAQAAVKARMADLYRQAGEPMPETSLATREQPTAGQRAPTPALPSPTRALGEPQPVAPREQPGIAAMATGEGPSMGGGTVGISQTPDFLRESLRRMYPGAINKAAAKEGTQNIIDASRDIPGAEHTISVDNTNKTVSMLDQGKGMSPQTMEDVFVKLGGSQKPAGASGGMGTAIKAVMANAEDTWVRSIARDPATGDMTDSVMHGSGDDFLGGTMHRYYAKLGEMPDSELAGAPPEIHQVGTGPNGTGTLVWTKPMADVNWDPYTLNNWISSFNRTSRIQGQTLHFVVDGKPVGPNEIVRGSAGNPDVSPIYEPYKPTEHLQSISVPGADIDFYGSKGTNESGYADVKLLNNGQYQADMFVQLPGNAKLPATLVADIKSTVDPKAVGYPWTADRNNLIDTVQQAIKNYVAHDLAGNIIGKENARVGSTIKDAPMIGPVKLVDDARIGETSQAARLQEVSQEPHYKRLASAVQDLHDNLIAELEGRNIPAPGGSETITQSHLVGLGVSDKWLGLNVPASFTPWSDAEPDARGILIEPWQIWHEVENAWGGAPREEQLSRFVDGLVATTLHEIAHNTSIGGHEQNFAGILTRVPQFLGSRMHAAIVKSLKARLSPVWDTLVNDLSYDAQRFRSVASESGLGRYGEDLPAGPEQRPAIGAGNAVLPDQGGPGAGGSRGGPAVPAGGPLEGSQPESLGPEAMAAAQPPSGPGGPLVVRSGGVRAAQAAQTLQQSLATIKPSRSQIAAATKDWLQLDRVGQRVSGLPPGVDTPRDLAAMRVHIDNLIQAGVTGKDWYINSAHKILDAVGGDMQDAEKLAQLVGMMARNVNPDQNINYAIEAWNQWKSGIPVANVHRFTDVSKEAADLLERNIPWDGRKTNSFYVNLMEELDPKLLAQRKATVDQWINRAYGYVTKAPSNAQYNFMENEMRRMATARGERPSQIQAQMWVGQMALQAPNQKGAEDFSHALARRMGQVGLETDNPELGKAFLDDNGTDIVARAFGGLGGHSFEAPGGFQTQVAGALTPQNAPGGQGLRPASRVTIDAIAAAKGHLLQLPEVNWTQVFPSTTAKDANAVDINAGRLLDPTETQDLHTALAQTLANASPAAGESAPYALIPTERGVWLRNTSDLDNPQFRSAVDAALRAVKYEGTWDAVPVRADSGRVTNDWSAQPDGEGFLEAIRRGGREDAFRSIQDSLAQRIADAQSSAAAPATESATSAATAPVPTSAALGGPNPGAADTAAGSGGRGPLGPVRDFLSGAESEAGSIAYGPAIRGAQFAGGVLGSEATQSDQDKQDPWGRFSRDVGFGLAAAAGPRALGAIARGGGVSYQDLKAIRPPQQGTLLNAARRAQTPAEMISAYTKQNLLSGAKTSVTNVISQLVELAKQPLGNLAVGHEEDAVAGVKAAGQAVPDAMRNFANTMRTGTTQFTTNTFPATSKFLPFFRLLSATDDFFRTLGWAMGAGQEGQRILREAGATSSTASKILGGSANRIDQAGQAAGRISVFGEGGALGGDQLSRIKQRLMSSSSYKEQALGLLLDQGIPFSSVPGRIWNTGLRRLPILSEAVSLGEAGVAAKRGDTYATQKALGDLAVSGVINASIISNIANGNIRGPDDKEHPNGIRLGGQWYDYSSWGAWALPIALPAAWYEAVRNEGNKPSPDQPKAIFNATGKVLENQFYAADIAKTLSQVGQGNLTGAGAQLVGSVADRFLPLSGMLNNATALWDPIMRDPTNKGISQFWENEMAKVPGVESQLPARPGMLTGGPEERRSSGPGQLIGMQTRTEAPLASEIASLERLGYQIPDPTKPPTQVSYGGSTIPLSEAEGRQLAYKRGELIDKMLNTYVSSPGFQNLKDNQKAQAISSRLNSVDSQLAEMWARQTPSAERQQRINAGRTVVGRLEPVGSGIGR